MCQLLVPFINVIITRISIRPPRMRIFPRTSTGAPSNTTPAQLYAVVSVALSRKRKLPTRAAPIVMWSKCQSAGKALTQWCQLTCLRMRIDSLYYVWCYCLCHMHNAVYVSQSVSSGPQSRRTLWSYINFKTNNIKHFKITLTYWIRILSLVYRSLH